MAIIMITAFIFTTVVLVITTDPKVGRCEYCEGPITLRELWAHIKKCPLCPKPKETK